MSVTATFTPATGTLAANGDASPDQIRFNRNAAGSIFVNNGATPISGGTPTVANTSLLTAFGFAGDDVIATDETQGALPQGNFSGGDGNDSVTGGSGADTLSGDAGNDILLGKGGADILDGGDGNDTLTGGDGDDQMFGGLGDDRMIWNPGDDTDLAEGGDGIDTVEVNGGNGAEVFTITANGERVRFDRVDPAPFAIDIGTSENLVLNANGGDDTVSVTGNVAALIKITVDGGAGNDTLRGGNGVDLLLGGDGNDFIDGNQGNDVALLGAGDDVFQWDPGDGSDTVEGQDGIDSLLFNGSNINENIGIFANGGRALFTRDIAAIAMDLNDVETINFRALGGADTINIGSLVGTDVSQVVIDLAASGGGGDGQVDSVIVNATAAADIVTVANDGTGGAMVSGLGTITSVTHQEATDRLVVNGGVGNDIVSADQLTAAIALVLDGGDGNDELTGSTGGDTIGGGAGNDILLGKGGADILNGGDGNDVLTGGDGDDQLFGGAGDDRMIWNPGDDTDLAEGGDGIDTVEVNGGNGAEVFAITANGERVRFDRVDPAPFAIDIGTSENLVLNANGGDDTVSVTGNVAALISITIDGGAGNDTLRGGNGVDLLLGGDGNDFIDGNQGNDVALLGAGDDVFQWDPGDGSDTVEGQDGIDTLLFNGSNISENISIFANGGRALFTRDIAAIAMDLNDIETIDFRALGGADTINVNGLAGTDVKQVAIDLAGTIGGTAGDAQADRVIVAGTAAGDTLTLTGSADAIVTTGLAATVTVSHSETADQIALNLGAGNDRVSATGVAAGGAGLSIDAGLGNDTIIGSQGADIILGGDGKDVVTGDGGADLALLGAGDDRFIWDPGDGSDVVEGQDGIDTLDFNGANASESMTLFANGGRVVLSRDIGAILMDLDDVEKINVRALGGSDAINVGDLTGTDVQQVTIDLAGVLLGTAGDALSDFVTLQATAGNDVVSLSGSGGTIFTTGLPKKVVVTHADGIDTIEAEGGAGNDMISAGALTGVRALLDGGIGDDRLTGGAGADSFLGGDGNDIVTGGKGNDLGLLGDGDDQFLWTSGSGSDTVEGQGGTDILVVTGSTLRDVMSIAANGARVLVTDGLAASAIDVDDVETLVVTTQAGADDIVVDDLGGTDVTQVTINLAATPAGGTGDHVVDRVTLNGTGGDDFVELRADGGAVAALGLAATVTISRTDANDQIIVNGGAGNDFLFVSTPPASAAQFVLDGGTGGDFLFGGVGNDIILGGAGADTIDGGAGADILDYRASATAVALDLGLGTGSAGDAAGDGIAGIEQVVGSLFADTLTGGANVDKLFGDGGNDILVGMGGNDDLRGDAGADRLTGGAGADQLTGGLGADRFVLLAAADSAGATRDVVRDFHHGEADRIDVSAIDARPAVNGNNAFTFIDTAAFSGVQGELRVTYGTGSSIVSGDIDGDAVADFAIILTGVTAAAPLVATDFFL